MSRGRGGLGKGGVVVGVEAELQAVHQLYLLTAGLAVPDSCPASPGPLISREGINQIFMGLAECTAAQMDY